MIGKYLRYQPYSPQNEHLDEGRMNRMIEQTNFLHFKTARYQIMIIFVVLKNYKIITKAEIVKGVGNITKSATVIIPEHKVLAFKPCTDFKNQVK